MRSRKKDALVITRDAQGGPRDAGEAPSYSVYAALGEPKDAPRDGSEEPGDGSAAFEA